MRKIISFVAIIFVSSFSVSASEHLQESQFPGRFVDGPINLKHPEILDACRKMRGAFAQENPLREAIERGGCTFKVVGLFSSYYGLNPKKIAIVAEGFQRYAPAHKYAVDPVAFFLSKLFARTFFDGLKEKERMMGAVPVHDYRQNATVIRRLVQDYPDALTCSTGGDLLLSYQRLFPHVLGEKQLTPENLLAYERRQYMKNISAELGHHDRVAYLRQGAKEERRIRQQKHRRLAEKDGSQLESLEDSMIDPVEASLRHPKFLIEDDVKKPTEGIPEECRKIVSNITAYMDSLHEEKRPAHGCVEERRYQQDGENQIIDVRQGVENAFSTQGLVNNAHSFGGIEEVLVEAEQENEIQTMNDYAASTEDSSTEEPYDAISFTYIQNDDLDSDDIPNDVLESPTFFDLIKLSMPQFVQNLFGWNAGVTVPTLFDLDIVPDFGGDSAD